MKWNRAILALFVCVSLRLAGADTAGDSQPVFRERDLSDMFYSDTLPTTRLESGSKTEPEAKPQDNGEAHRTKPRTRAEPGRRPKLLARRVGFKYRLQVSDSACTVRETSPAQVFHAGDRLRFNVESNIDGYLYVIQKGSTGRESILFPDPSVNGGDNRIARGVPYSVPPTDWFEVDHIPGVESLLVVVSRQPLKSVPARADYGQPSISLAALFTELNGNVRARDLMLLEEHPPVVAGAAPRADTVIVINTSEDRNNIAYREIVLNHR